MREHHKFLLRAVLTIGLVGAPAPVFADWTHARGGRDNAGYTDVDSVRVDASTPHVIVRRLTRVPYGAGPVVGADGTAYFVTRQNPGPTLGGELKAVAADGSERWTAILPEGATPIASPLVGADGGIYVAGIRQPERKVQDSTGPRPRWLYTEDSLIFRYSPNGALQWTRRFPVTRDEGSGKVSGGLSSFMSGGIEIIVTTFDTPFPKRYTRQIVGFAANGAVMFWELMPDNDGFMADEPLCVTMDCVFGVSPWQRPKVLAPIPDDARPPTGTVTIAPGNVLVAHSGRWIRGYTHAPGSNKLEKRFEKHDGKVVTSASAAMPDGRLIYGLGEGRIGQVGSDGAKINDVDFGDFERQRIETPPAQLRSGRLVMMGRHGKVWLTDGGKPIRTMQLSGQSIAAISASRNYFYASTADALVTFDAETWNEVGRFPWTGGGLSSPAIGNNGLVYALAGNFLYIFGKPNSPTPRVASDGQASGGAAPTTQIGRDVIRTGANLCLDVHAPDIAKNGAKVQVWGCHRQPNQLWAYDRTTRMLRVTGGLCLDVHTSEITTNGGRVQLWACHGQPNQQWTPAADGTLRNGGGLCLDVHAPDQFKNGGRVQVWACHGAHQQRFSSTAFQ